MDDNLTSIQQAWECALLEFQKISSERTNGAEQMTVQEMKRKVFEFDTGNPDDGTSTLVQTMGCLIKLGEFGSEAASLV